MNRRQSNEKGPVGCAHDATPLFSVEHTALFERMFARSIVEGPAVMDDVGLRWVEVAARWIDAERPPRMAVLLPGRQPHRAAQELPYGSLVDRGGHGSAVEQRRVRHLVRQGHLRQLYERRALVAPKRVRLSRPVEVPQRPREAVEVMLRPIVIAERNHACRLETPGLRLLLRKLRDASIQFGDGGVELLPAGLMRGKIQLALHFRPRQTARLELPCALRVAGFHDLPGLLLLFFPLVHPLGET